MREIATESLARGAMRGRIAAPAVLRLTLTDFRCYGALRLDTDARPVVLTGPNGAGKTNLLEALSLLAPGRGLRHARLSDLTRLGASGGWAIAAALQGAHGAIEIGTALAAGTAEAPTERRLVKIEGALARGPAALAGALAVSWITPQMDRLFVDGAAGRRRFLDRLVFGFDAGHARRVASYERALRERARLLRTGRGNAGWLAALERALAEEGVAVAAARREAVARLARAMAEAPGPFPAAELSLRGTPEDWLAEDAALAAEDRLREALGLARVRDAAMGGAAVGPHRSDLVVRHARTGQPAEQCSTGEQKALLLAIVLADARLRELRFGAPPLLLLDEVAAHLDAERRAALFREILRLGGQAWLTGTDRGLFAQLGDRAQFLHIANGRALAGGAEGS